MNPGYLRVSSMQRKLREKHRVNKIFLSLRMFEKESYLNSFMKDFSLIRIFLHSFTQFQPAHFFFIKKFNYLINSFSSFLQFIIRKITCIHFFFKTNFFFLKGGHLLF